MSIRDFFNPQPVDVRVHAQRAYEANLSHLLAVLGGTLRSSFAYQRFHSLPSLSWQGSGAEIVTPEGNQGNYFATQSRDAFRRELLEILSPPPVSFFGTHQIKLGTSVTLATDHGGFNYRPVDVKNTADLLPETIDYSAATPYKRADLEVTSYIQDHWSPTSKISFGLGVTHRTSKAGRESAHRAARRRCMVTV